MSTVSERGFGADSAGELPESYRWLPLITWSGLVLGVILPITAMVVRAGYPHSDAALCAAQHVQVGSGRVRFPTPGAPVLLPLPTSVLALIWLGITAATAALVAAGIRYAAQSWRTDNTGTAGWLTLAIAGLVVLIGNAVVAYLVYHDGLGTVAHCVA